MSHAPYLCIECHLPVDTARRHWRYVEQQMLGVDGRLARAHMACAQLPFALGRYLGRPTLPPGSALFAWRRIYSLEQDIYGIPYEREGNRFASAYDLGKTIDLGARRRFAPNVSQMRRAAVALTEQDFQTALATTLREEGGYVDKKTDRGGPTNMGITLPTLAAWRAKQAKAVPTKADIVALTKEEATAIYRAFYWDLAAMNMVDDAYKAQAMFDLGVLSGLPCAAKLAQKASACLPDSHMGPKTLAAIAQMSRDKFLLALINQANQYFVAIVQNDISQLANLQGWTKRVAKYHPLIFGTQPV